jgi:heptosyltransferase-2
MSRNKKNSQQILIRSPNWIGDQVMAFPFFKKVRECYPDAWITSVGVPWVKDLQYQSLVDEVVTFRKGHALQLSYRPDLAFTLTPSFSSAWQLYKTRARVRVGSRSDFRSLLLTHAVDLNASQHRAQNFLNLVDAVVKKPKPELSSKGEVAIAEFDVKKYWPGFESIAPPETDYWVLAPGATADSRRWDVQNFKQLAIRIKNEMNLTGVIIGGKSEKPLAQFLTQDSTLGLIDFTDRGPIPTLASIFKSARFSVTNESGLAHVASLLSSQTSFVEVICGAADPRHTHPLGPAPVDVVTNAIDCWPCEKNVCRLDADRKNLCLKGIGVDGVFERIRKRRVS